jgi:uncharacterized protein (DUF433 family)
MKLEDYLDFQGPDVIRLRGHRLGLEHIVERYQEGYSPEQIMQYFPGLSLEQIYGTIAYYLHNKAEVDAYIARINKEAEGRYQEAFANPSPLMQRLRSSMQQRRREREQPIS